MDNIFRVEKDDIGVSLYRNFQDVLKINLYNRCEDVTLTLYQAESMIDLLSRATSRGYKELNQETDPRQMTLPCV